MARLLPEAQFASAAAAMAAATYISILAEPATGYERLGHYDRSEDDQTGAARSVANYITTLIIAATPLIAVAVGFLTGSLLNAVAIAPWAVSLVQVRWISLRYLIWGEQARYATTILIDAAVRASAMLIALAMTRNGAWAWIAGASSPPLWVHIVPPPRCTVRS